MAAGNRGLRIIDVSNPSAPFEAGFYDSPVGVSAAFVSGPNIYAAQHDYGIDIYAFNPTNRVVTIVATDPLASQATGGTGSGQFTLTRTGDTDSALAIQYTLGGTATNGTDYDELSGTVTIPVGASSVSISVDPIDDMAAEGTETVSVRLSSDEAYTVGFPSRASVTIVDNEQKSTVSITAQDPHASETGSAGRFIISRTGITSTSVVVQYTIGGKATNGVDYKRLPKSATIPVGSPTVAIEVLPIDDTVPARNEAVLVTLAEHPAYNIDSPSSAEVTIADNEKPIVTIDAEDDFATETGDLGHFVVRRVGDLSSDLLVSYAVGGTAVNGIDYKELQRVVRIPQGAASKGILVRPIDDKISERGERVVVTLSADNAYIVGSQKSAEIVIFDND